MGAGRRIVAGDDSCRVYILSLEESTDESRPRTPRPDGAIGKVLRVLASVREFPVI
jgi:hypothetical protein